MDRGRLNTRTFKGRKIVLPLQIDEGVRCEVECTKILRAWLLFVRWGRQEDLMEKQGDDEQPKVVEKANFGLSGALAKDVSTGNTHNGVVMKWSEPPEARVPEKKWRLYVFKNDENIGGFILIAHKYICGYICRH